MHVPSVCSCPKKLLCSPVSQPQEADAVSKLLANTSWLPGHCSSQGHLLEGVRNPKEVVPITAAFRYIARFVAQFICHKQSVLLPQNL